MMPAWLLLKQWDPGQPVWSWRMDGNEHHIQCMAFRSPRSGPPEGFFDFVGDVAPREANVAQVPVGPSGEFLTRLVALPPDVQGLA